MAKRKRTDDQDADAPPARRPRDIIEPMAGLGTTLLAHSGMSLAEAVREHDVARDFLSVGDRKYVPAFENDAIRNWVLTLHEMHYNDRRAILGRTITGVLRHFIDAEIESGGIRHEIAAAMFGSGQFHRLPAETLRAVTDLMRGAPSTRPLDVLDLSNTAFNMMVFNIPDIAIAEVDITGSEFYRCTVTYGGVLTASNTTSFHRSVVFVAGGVLPAQCVQRFTKVLGSAAV